MSGHFSLWYPFPRKHLHTLLLFFNFTSSSLILKLICCAQSIHSSLVLPHSEILNVLHRTASRQSSACIPCIDIDPCRARCNPCQYRTNTRELFLSVIYASSLFRRANKSAHMQLGRPSIWFFSGILCIFASNLVWILESIFDFRVWRYDGVGGKHRGETSLLRWCATDATQVSSWTGSLKKVTNKLSNGMKAPCNDFLPRPLWGQERRREGMRERSKMISKRLGSSLSKHLGNSSGTSCRET